MACILNTAVLAAALAIPLTTAPAGSARANSLMTACKVDVASLCKGVPEGRGRISACLFAHDNRISGTCKPELSKITSSGTFRKMVPSSLNSLKGSAGDTQLRRVCAGDIKTYCGGVGSATDRILACLYAWSNRIGKSCHAEAKAILTGGR
ncbi:cysteine rich repeat-containing protein [Roseibium sp. Sym1]|uniref:cysteine rich repeat-containing protein n=1 Tax=Roseibium sp. Sym1 TaxID=3016006 RepID=UPI0022B3DB99|nr:cysteine rich repeat-containing protein [Roseibium sp. Sym1]